jgi:tetratricopeptide (TPR) repeat protein
MLVPDSDIAAGCFTSLRIERGKLIGARGPAATQVERLLKQSGCEQSLMPAESHLPQGEEAMDAFILLAQAYHHSWNDQFGRASDRIEKFVDLRPESSSGYSLSATIAVQQERFDLAEQHFQKALELNPEAATARLFYAKFLTKRRPDEALEMIESLAEYDALKSYVALLTFNILSGRGQFQRCGELLAEAVKLNPRNAYLRLNLGACQGNLEKIDEAVANFAKAVELLPERGPFRGQLANLLEEAGRLDEAEKHFRELLKIEPDNPVVHFWLAKFLAKHRPQAKDEALKEAQIALELPSKRGLPKEKIERVIQELQSETTPVP